MVSPSSISTPVAFFSVFIVKDFVTILHGLYRKVSGFHCGRQCGGLRAEIATEGQPYQHLSRNWQLFLPKAFWCSCRSVNMCSAPHNVMALFGIFFGLKRSAISFSTQFICMGGKIYHAATGAGLRDLRLRRQMFPRNRTMAQYLYTVQANRQQYPVWHSSK